MRGIVMAAASIFLLVLGIHAWHTFPRDFESFLAHAPSWKAALVISLGFIFAIGSIAYFARRFRA